MEPKSLTGPVYTLSPSVKASKAAGSSIRDYIDPVSQQPGSAFNQAVAAADAAARAGSTVQGKSVQDYVAANRGVFNFAASANGAHGDGKSLADYQAGAGGAAASASSSSAIDSLVPSLSDTTQGETVQSYVNAAAGKASSAASSASSAAAPAEQKAAGSTAGMTIQQYFAAAQGTTTP